MRFFLPWKIKVFIFRVIQKYKLFNLLKFIQKHLTKRSLENHIRNERFWKLILNGLEKYDIANRKNVKCLEIGGGQSLSQNIFLSKFVHNQIVIDINRLLNIDFTSAAIKYIDNSKPLVKDELDLQLYYGISYIAPCDVRKFPFEENSFDAIYTTNVFEHIPEVDLKSILKTFNAILKYDGILLLIIDYTDHYSHTDPRIGDFNFRNFTNDEWERYNFPIHYQNRLDNNMYTELIKNSGFVILENYNISDGMINFEIGKYDEFFGGYFICKKA